ncbi:MAG: LptF/LptG family permease [Halanaerobiales bacterium]|nr:LptF/LptG family permease [Halanaerobiales bacterium]
MSLNFIKILDKYLIKEVSKPFIMGVFTITIILLGNYLFQLTDLIIVKNVPIALVAELLFYKLPDVVVETFPIAILFATMTGIGRLSRESEITAFRMGGVSLYRLIIPVLIVGIIVSAFTFVLNEEIVPWSNHEAQNIIRQTILKDAMPSLEEEVFFKGPKGRLFYIKSYDEEQGIIENIVIYDTKGSDDINYPEVITASQGIIEEDQWRLKEGLIHRYNEDGNIIMESRFQNMEIQITEEMRDIYSNQRTTKEMSREELSRQINLFQKSGINVNSLLVDYHLKLSEPLTAFIFVLIGVPLSLVNKESKTLNIIMTIVIIFLYYLILSVSRSLGRNFLLSPLMAAWLPNIIFFVVGLLILVWRESWERFVYKLLPGMFVIIFTFLLIAVPLNSVQARQDLNISSDSVKYNAQEKIVEITGNISGNYGKYYIRSENINIMSKEGEEKLLTDPEKVELIPGDFSGCDYEVPHYFFDAQKVNIYPNDYLEAYHVVFRELNGKLPLFYWPYLYISLKDEERDLIPKVGYNRERGWFLKLTYYYSIFDLPGRLYMDYYTKSGFAGGFKQYFINNPKQQGHVYFYQQENKTDINNLFVWEGEIAHQYQSDNWRENFLLQAKEYSDSLNINSKFNLDYSYNTRRINLASEYEQRDYFTNPSRNSKEYGIDLSYREEIFDNFDLGINYVNDYSQTAQQGLEESLQRSIDLQYRWGEGWETGLSYQSGQRQSSERDIRTRWSANSYISKYYKNLRFKLLLERYDPQFSEEDEVNFYKLPEFIIEYRPRNNFDYKFVIGNYNERDRNLKGPRAQAQVSYDNRWNILENSILRTEQSVQGSVYGNEDFNFDQLDYQVTTNSQFEFDSYLTDNLKLTNSYSYIKQFGDSYFTFDRVEPENLLENELRYDLNRRLDFRLEGGYDFKNDEYLLLEALTNLKVMENWEIDFGLVYDLNRDLFNDNLILKSNFYNSRWQHKLGIEYNINDGTLEKLDNQIIYELAGDWGWYIENNISINTQRRDPIREANLQIKKKLHCREIIFSYDYVKDEYTLEYSINLFPSQGIEFIKTEDDLTFDIGIEERLKEDDNRDND